MFSVSRHFQADSNLPRIAIKPEHILELVVERRQSGWNALDFVGQTCSIPTSFLQQATFPSV